MKAANIVSGNSSGRGGRGQALHLCMAAKMQGMTPTLAFDLSSLATNGKLSHSLGRVMSHSLGRRGVALARLRDIRVNN